MSKRRGGDEGFFLRGTIWWIRTDPVTGRQASTKAKTRAQRDAWYEVRYRQSIDPEYQPPSKSEQSLNHWALRFVEHKAATKSAATASFYGKKLGHVVRIFGAHTSISVALRAAAFDRYTAVRLEEGARPTTIRKEIGAARTLARFAARAGAYHGKPELFMPDLPDDYEPGERFLKPEELAALLAQLAPKSPDRAAWVALAVAIGSRFSETPRITRADVDTVGWLVHVRGSKTKRSKGTIPIAAPFRPLLLRALPFLPLKRWTNSNMKRDLALACARAGIEPVTSNDLRRTHGSWLAQAGVGDEHIGKVLRHSDGRMARRVYGQLPPAQLGRLLDATIAQQSETSAGPPYCRLPTNSAEPAEDDMWIENPRVGGSIPSRDTAENQRFQDVAARSQCHDVAPGAVKSRHVRNDSATVDRGMTFGLFLLGSSERARAFGEVGR